MICKDCPFNKGTKVRGEGSRILREWVEETEGSNSSIKLRTNRVERDNEGQYDVVVVAMAPAREEVREGRVLIGISGQTLRGVLKQLGVEEFYLCNVLLCPIPDGSSDFEIQKAVDLCRNVITEVKERKPKLVIALGDLPYRTFTENLDYTITELGGRVIPSKVGPLVPLPHPAYYLRNPNDFFDFIEGMRSGLKVLNGTYVQVDTPELVVVTPDNLDEVRNDLDKADELAVDLETSGFHPYAWDPAYILEMGISRPPYNKAYIVTSELIPEFKRLLEEKDGVYWNGSFDASFLKVIGINPKVSFDGMLAHYTMDERGYGHGLKKVAGLYLGCEDWEKNIKQYLPTENSSYELIPTHIRYQYLSKDVTRTGLLKGVLTPDINQKIFNELLMPACRMFIDIEHHGQRINPVLLMEMEPVLTQDMEKIEQEIYDLTKDWINPNSPKQVKELVYGKMHLPIDPYFGASTSKDALAPYKDDPVVSRIINYRQFSKMRGAYVMNFAKYTSREFRIHPKINLWRAVSGRLSSEDPSIMNIKSDSRLKEVFLPEVGHVLGTGDIKGNELRWYGINARDEELLAIFNSQPTEEEPRANDPHYLVSRAAYGEEKADELRTPAKAVVFGRLYGRGKKSIEYQVGSGNIEKLMEIVDSFFPAIQRFRQEVFAQVKEHGYLESYFGRKRRFPLLTRDNKHNVEREAVNFMQQSPGSDLMLYNMLNIWENREKWGVFPFWPVHDSITWDMEDKGILPEMQKVLEEYSYEMVDHKLFFPWDMDWGINWAMHKEKK
ncbi:hypothetical protein LCGC14_0902330 [marine sediment metagenome]|uniref:DNA-directed DNA polymerase n=1 Tax=marine sediment metagenome TaxID=412755 RepID=A0A0F9S2Z3_9ZZZZ